MIHIDRLTLEDVTFAYPNSLAVLDNFSLEIPAAPLVWLKAPPGSGKSSILKLMAGLISPQSGKYWIDDVCVSELSFAEFLPYRLQIGYSFDMGGLLSNRSLYENLMLPLLFHQRCSTEDADTLVRRWMEKFNIDGVQHQRPFSVSGGQRKSAILLRAFIHSPQVVLLDDPMAGLKEDGRAAFSELVQEFHTKRGLKKIIFCAERELPIKNLACVEVRIDRKAEAA